MSYTYQVTTHDSAKAMGSGGLEVLATPRLVAYLENACYQELQEKLEPGMTSVGASIQVDHLAPSKIGAVIEVKITDKSSEGKLVTYGIEAWDGSLIIARAKHTRAVVKARKFMDRLMERNFEAQHKQ